MTGTKPVTKPYPEVTAAVLPSSLGRGLSITLVYSTRLPVLVCGTGTERTSHEDFPVSLAHGNWLSSEEESFTSRLVLTDWRIYQPILTTRLYGQTSVPLSLPFCVSPHVQTRVQWYRNINLLSIGYTFRSRLRTD